MKKIILFISAGIIISSTFSSCNRTYTCECINIQGEEKTYSVLATNRTEAQNDCNEYGLMGHCEIKK